MPGRPSLLLFLAFCGIAWPLSPAVAATTLPSLALDPPPPPSSPSFWSGLYVGSEVFGISGNGSKGHVGGAAELGYNHEFADRIVVGINAASGYSPALFGFGPVKGFDFGEADAMVGYDMGRWMPYVMTGVVLAKPIVGPGANYVDVSQSANDLFSGPGSLRVAPMLGAGVDYAVTDRLHVDLSVSGGNSLSPSLPP